MASSITPSARLAESIRDGKVNVILVYIHRDFKDKFAISFIEKVKFLVPQNECILYFLAAI